MTTVTLTWAEQDKLVERLNQAAAAGELTADMLAEAIRGTGASHSTSTPQSLGLEWIKAHPRPFREAVDDVETFLRSLFDCPLTALVTRYPSIMYHIPHERLTTFVRELFSCQSPRSGWICDLLYLEIPTREVGEIVISLLEATTICETSRSNNFITKDFLAHSCLHVVMERNGKLRMYEVEQTPWSVLSGEQLQRAVNICTQKLPTLLLERGYHDDFSVLQLLRLRLPNSVIRRMVEAAAEHVISYKDLVVDSLMWLSTAQRIKLMAKVPTDIPIDLLVRTALELPAKAGIELCELLDYTFLNTAPAPAYRRLWQTIQNAMFTNKEMAEWILNRLTTQLLSSGFILAQVTSKERFSNTHQRTEHQLVVIGPDNVTYIGTFRQLAYRATVGDWVIVDTKRPLETLIPRRVYVVHFMPAHHDGEYQ
jgi:hypothetical protein